MNIKYFTIWLSLAFYHWILTKLLSGSLDIVLFYLDIIFIYTGFEIPQLQKYGLTLIVISFISTYHYEYIKTELNKGLNNKGLNNKDLNNKGLNNKGLNNKDLNNKGLNNKGFKNIGIRKSEYMAKPKISSLIF